MTWTAPEVDITDEPLLGAERPMLEAWLDRHRATFLGNCAGLTGEQLAEASAPPSNMSLLGLIRHLADVERVWFRVRLAGQDVKARHSVPGDWDGAFEGLDPDRAEAEYAELVAEMAECRAAAATRDLDDIFLHERVGEISVRWLYIHLIEEYAQHNGHADLLRERIDGRTNK
ncbi:DinB family protein [Lentzea sp. NBC_00516]|uniref:DinB family protein n=1 Tax=Lentzea sp. NBC_00516 TaxID=2903582 RepID=UPI002E815A97|nr:DinB family protein [Lentzea sp. NBC_00516]WUD28827.1 DinB family protein [Lentzea sp. NBC_00516]